MMADNDHPIFVAGRQFLVRDVCVDDADGYMRLLPQLSQFSTQAHNVARFAQFVEEVLTVRHRIVVMVDAATDAVVAAATLIVEPKCIHDFGFVGHVEDVIVDDLYRGCGLGKQLVNWVCTTANGAGCYKVILDCSDDNVEFYTRCGFKRHGAEMAMYFA